ncbi:MAG: quinone oxidoreductase [Alphaproteobacteria bacterium]|nr:quinone oxidoreductase [Alphaproteobacteria bacterium]MDE2109644.1 quinone oxidoreductase [Alphaproteobacteria bacterium]MDE2492345.1 quinone oxidoreductase [Alphaproteobacteria bacterium]
MKAIRFAKTGGPAVLSFDEVELAPPAPGQVRLRHTAIGVNFIDTYQRSGLYKLPLPSGLGSEAAGVVEALGQRVTNLKVGDRVGYCTGPVGAYAEANNVPADRVVKLPSGVGDETAAAALLKGMTAHYLLKRTFPVQRGQIVLIHSAAGGVGLIAGQWAKHLGATVIGTVGSDDKIALAKAHGYDHVLNLQKDDWAAYIREVTKGEGVPVVYDSVGKDTFMGSLDCLAVRGMMVSFGNSSGAVPAIEPAILSAKGSLYLTRPTLFHYVRTAQELQETASDLFAVIASGAVKITVNQRFALKDARAAHEALHSRKTTGATVLVP